VTVALERAVEENFALAPAGHVPRLNFSFGRRPSEGGEKIKNFFLRAADLTHIFLIFFKLKRGPKADGLLL